MSFQLLKINSEKNNEKILLTLRQDSFKDHQFDHNQGMDHYLKGAGDGLKIQGGQV